MPVAPDGGVGHCPVNVQEDLLALIGSRQREMLAIPCRSEIRQLPGYPWKLLLERAFDGPVMGEIERAPSLIVEIRLGIGDARARLGSLGTRDWPGAKSIGRGEHPRLEEAVVERAGIGRVSLDEPPILVERSPLASEWLFGRIDGSRAHES